MAAQFTCRVTSAANKIALQCHLVCKQAMYVTIDTTLANSVSILVINLIKRMLRDMPLLALPSTAANEKH
jgi:hypothetical protein